MNKENKRLAQERTKENSSKVMTLLSNWGPVILIVVVVAIMLAAIITSGGAGSGSDVGDTEDGYVFVDEDGNELEVTDWTEIEE